MQPECSTSEVRLPPVHCSVRRNQLGRVMLTAIAGTLSAACTPTPQGDPDPYTLYSSSLPSDHGRSPIATFSYGIVPGMNQMMCNEAAEMYKTDFDRRKRNTELPTNAIQRFWCEKGEFRP